MLPRQYSSLKSDAWLFYSRPLDVLVKILFGQDQYNLLKGSETRKLT